MIMMISDSEAVMVVTTTFVQRCGGVEVIMARSRPWPGRAGGHLADDHACSDYVTLVYKIR